MFIDRAGWPFIALAAVPPALAFLAARPTPGAWLLLLPVGIALFFRDPERQAPMGADLILAPADGKVIFAGVGRTGQMPPGAWRQVTIFLSPLDVHINRTPVSGRVARVDYRPGTFLPAYRAEAHQNEQSEIWFEHDGQPVVARQVVGMLARRVVCRLSAGDTVEAGMRFGLMKFGSRMDVFVPMTATLTVSAGQRVRGGETVIARLASGGH
jgi:phosphatidylserine decarboxylase